MKKLLCVFLLLTMFVTLISCQEEPDLREYSMDEILALPEFEGFAEATVDDVMELSKKYWLWENRDRKIVTVYDEVNSFMEEKSGTVLTKGFLKVDEEFGELEGLNIMEFSSAILAQAAMNQCPSLKALGEENPSVQYRYGNCIVIRVPATKLSPAKYPDIELALLDAEFVKVQRTEEDSPLLLIPALGEEKDIGKGIRTYPIYYSAKCFEKNIYGILCKIWVLQFNDIQHWEIAKPALTEYFGEIYERYTYGECVLVPCDMQYAESVAAMVDALKQ